MSGRRTAATIVLLVCANGVAWSFDPLETQRALHAVDLPECDFAPAMSHVLHLQEAVERALCRNPKAREAWAGVKAQAAAVGVARAAYLPRVSASLQELHDEARTDVAGHPEFSSAGHVNVLTRDVTLSWMLYDFGGRDAALRNASELLAAAQATHEASFQAVIAATAKDYYAAQAANGAVSAAEDVERTARRSAEVAEARVDSGAAPISDLLQAQTAAAQARYALDKAQGDRQVALGELASDMGLQPESTLDLPPVEEGVMADEDFERSASALIDEALRIHPTVLAASAQFEAATAKTAQTRAEGLPSLSLNAKTTRNNQPVSPAAGQPQLSAAGREWSVGLQLNVPLFEGFSRTYAVRQAQAQADAKGAELDDAREQVGRDVWAAYQGLQAATRNVRNSDTTVKIAIRSLQVGQARYAAGVGSIVELLNAQAAVANTRRDRVRSLADWRSARLQLAAKLGSLEMSRIVPTAKAR